MVPAMTVISDISSHPALQGFSEVVPLSGFSGADVALVRSGGGGHFVRKAARDAKVSVTLQRQSKRQAWLRSALGEAATVPEVLGEGEVDGLYYFDMSFVPSRDATSFLSTASFGELASFADRVSDFMRILSRLSGPPGMSKSPTREAILEKLDEITLKTDGVYAETLDPLRRATLMLPHLVDDGNAQPTLAHGDLTFENILIDKTGHLWLIDPIESPFDHYWIDWSKLFQECEGRWHVHRGRPIAAGVTWWLRNRWLKDATELSPLYASRHYLLLSLIFARILPYAQSEKDQTLVAERVRRYGQAALAEVKELK